MMRELIMAIAQDKSNDEDVLIAKGKYEYPKNFRDVCKKIWLLKE